MRFAMRVVAAMTYPVVLLVIVALLATGGTIRGESDNRPALTLARAPQHAISRTSRFRADGNGFQLEGANEAGSLPQQRVWVGPNLQLRGGGSNHLNYWDGLNDGGFDLCHAPGCCGPPEKDEEQDVGSDEGGISDESGSGETGERRNKSSSDVASESSLPSASGSEEGGGEGEVSEEEEEEGEE